MRTLTVLAETWPLHTPFAISRGTRTEAHVVSISIAEGEHVGHGECLPYARYDETVDGVVETIERLADAIGAGLDRAALASALPPGAARNAIDCALWDLEAKRTGRRAWEIAGLDPPTPVLSAFTIGLDTPDAMAARAAAESARPLLKLKLGGSEDLERVRGVRSAVPDTRLIVDANEAWTPAQVRALLPAFADLGVELVEQPLPTGDDAVLAEVDHPIPVCADESCHTSDDVTALRGRYEMINIKLDKTGGLTEALRLVDAARDQGMGIMVGCMIATSLGLAPAVLPAQFASYVDLDAPLWLGRDRSSPLRFEGSIVYPADPALWG